MSIRDAGSSNGTVVNGVRITGPVPLGPKDVVMIGATTVRLTDHPAADTIATVPIDRAFRPWFERGKNLLLTAGAVAAAITAVIALWAQFSPPPDLVDSGEIAALESQGPTLLSEFETDGLGGSAELVPEQDSVTGKPPGQDRTPLTRVVSWNTAVVPPSSPPRAPVAPPAEPLPVSPTPSASTVPVPQPTLIPSPGPGRVPANGLTSDPLSGDTVYGDDAVNVMGTPVPALTASPAATRPPGDPGGESPPRDAGISAEMRSEFVEAMRFVEFVETTKGIDYRGFTVAADIIVEGLAGKRIVLWWRLAGEEIPEVWSEEKLAYTLHADRDRDRGSVTIWVPDLVSPAPYQVNVRIAYEGGITIARRTLLFPAEE